MTANYIQSVHGTLDGQLDEAVVKLLEANSPFRLENVHLQDRVGKWSAIDNSYFTFKNSTSSVVYILALFEHNYYGDMAAMVLAFYDYRNNIWVELAETYDSIEQILQDLDMID